MLRVAWMSIIVILSSSGYRMKVAVKSLEITASERYNTLQSFPSHAKSHQNFKASNLSVHPHQARISLKTKEHQKSYFTACLYFINCL